MQNPASRTWSIHLDVTEPGWLAVPSGLTGDAAAEWVAAQKQELSANWGDTWEAKPQAMAEEMLRSALRDRDPQDIIAFMVWPVAGQPIAVHVHIGVADSADLAALTQRETVEATPIAAHHLGPGLHISEVRQVPEFGTAMAQSLMIFTNAEGVALVIAVDATLVQLLAAISKGLQDVLDSIRAVDGNGSPFAAVVPDGYVIDETAVWNLEDGADRGH